MANVLVDLADKLGVLEGIKDKLFHDPRKEHSTLARALETFAASFQRVDQLLSRLLSLSFVSDAPESLKITRELLIEAEGGGEMVRAQEIRGHCSDLLILYDRRLRPSLQSVLKPADLPKVDEAFRCLEEFHEHTLPELQSLMDWLSTTASKLLEKVDRGELKEADDLLKQARIDVLQQRQAISKAVSRIMALTSAYEAATRSPRTA
jgi:hypothetical protein